jgi:hypothetical protein
VLTYFLLGPPVEYDPFVTSMMTKSEDLPLDVMLMHLITFEAR